MASVQVSPTPVLRGSAWPVTGLGILLLVSLVLMSRATEGSAQFGRLYSVLLVVNALGLIGLSALILWNLVGLLKQVASKQAGARLTARMVTTFTILSVTPVVVVFVFSLQFLNQGIESWFDVRIEQALKDALTLGQISLDGQMRDRFKQTELMAADIADIPNDAIAGWLNDNFRLSSASELTLVHSNGTVIAANTDANSFVPNRPDEAVLLQLRQARSYIGLDPIGDSGLFVRAAVEVPGRVARDKRFLQALFPVDERMNVLADSVQRAFAKYRELAYLREPLKTTFTLTLSLVLAFSLLSAVLAAFFFGRRLVAPLSAMASATRAVADGDYEGQLPAQGSDEVGFLVESFNDMTRRLAMARDETRLTQQQVEAQRTYLQAVLLRLTSGVITTDADHRLFTANNMAGQILGIELESELGEELSDVALRHSHLLPLVQLLDAHIDDDTPDWREELILLGPNGRQVLMCRGAPIGDDGIEGSPEGSPDGSLDSSPDSSPDSSLGASTSEATQAPFDANGTSHGQLVVFDDLTTLIEAQRNQAWSEVARRLAHEIKNPLTPIQLSAERLRHKYLAHMEPTEAETFDRLTRTIVHQVEAMKQMVNAFSDYARTPEPNPKALDLNQLVTDVAELYRAGAARIMVRLDSNLPMLFADPDRLRQVLHNLIKNAREACPAQGAEIRIATRATSRSARQFLELSVSDNGGGIEPKLLERLFEPYVSSKPKGTGLGLAIVKKIVEEHTGSVRAENPTAGGAQFVVQLPAMAAGKQAVNERRISAAPLRPQSGQIGPSAESARLNGANRGTVQ